MSFKGTPMQHNTIKFITITFAGLLTLNATAMQIMPLNTKYTDPIAREYRTATILLQNYPEQLEAYNAQFHYEVIMPLARLNQGMQLMLLKKHLYTKENMAQVKTIVISAIRSHANLIGEIKNAHPEFNISEHCQEIKQESKAALEGNSGLSLLHIIQMHQSSVIPPCDKKFIPRTRTKQGQKKFSLI